jgi:hypothetical protein
MNGQNLVDMVLTSIVNNDYLLNSLKKDLSDRFHVNFDEEKLRNYLSSVTLRLDKNETILV